ncbi:hypothetical protein ACOMHN_030481 [Nucella lapillus]
MTDPPGSVGWPVVGDQSLDFNNDAVNFVNTYIQQYKSRIFAGRLLNKPSIFVCSNRGVRQVLSDKTGTFDHGYKPLMEQTFGDNILFYNGMTSVPVKLKLPGCSFESCFCKAMVAKKELLSLISSQRGKAASSFLRRVEDLASEEDGDLLNNHLLLFSSAILPKALSSLLTTFAIEMGRPQMDTVVDGYRVPAGYSVLYMTHAAHRDPSVFSSPEVFRPDRWNDTKALSDDNLFVFGQGRRNCLGEHLTRYIMQSIVRHLLQCYHWVLPERQDLSLKYMPVSRPKHPIHVRLLPQQGDAVNLSSTTSSSSPDTSYDSDNSLPDTMAPCCQCQCGTVDVTGHSRQCQCYTGE